MDYLDFAKKTLSRGTIERHQELARTGLSPIGWEQGYALQQTDALIAVLIDIAKSLRDIRTNQAPRIESHTEPGQIDSTTFRDVVEELSGILREHGR